MLKRRLIALIVGIALVVTITGVSTVVADSVGLPVTPSAFACGGSGGSGGGC